MRIPRPRRMPNRDYSSRGFYFVTICADFKRCVFGKVINARLEHSALGRIIEEGWIALANHFAGIRLHAHIVMPNHLHGIIEICSERMAQRAAPLQRGGGAGIKAPGAVSLSVVVRAFKADVTRRAGRELGWTGEIWQRNYYDRVIRDGREFANALRYIAENPLRWQSQANRFAENRGLASSRKAQRAAPLQRGT
jgi:REP-associated tyrosine transposase